MSLKTTKTLKCSLHNILISYIKKMLYMHVYVGEAKGVSKLKNNHDRNKTDIWSNYMILKNC